MSIEEKLNRKRAEKEYATTWKPDPGDVLQGTYERTQTVETAYGLQQVSHIRIADGTLWAVWHSHKVFREQWDEADPHQGDTVGIMYDGTREGEQYTYHVYHVAVERADDAGEPAGEPAGDAESTSQPKDAPLGGGADEPRQSAERDPERAADAAPTVNDDGTFNFDAVSPGLPY